MLNGHIHCPRGVCQKAATDPRYRRSRASILIEVDGSSLLFDTSQDFRQQMLDRAVPRIDAVLYTHGHADHIYGLADIRSYCAHQRGAIPIYGAPATLAILYQCFDYVFNPPTFVGGGIPVLEAHALHAPMVIRGQEIIPIPVEHGPLQGCQGYRLGNVAYIPDVKTIPESSLAMLEGLDLLILNCLRYRPHASHLSMAESHAYAERLRPRRCLFTHLTHDIDAAEEEANLPEWMRFAYDGLVVELP
jgi:phosphoribosyl 1,2-cyclic phosphate phosphodiesterase